MAQRGYPVVPQDIPCALQTTAVYDIEDTPQEVSFGEGGAIAVRRRFVNLGAAVATRGYICHDPIDEAAAIAMLLSDESRMWYFITDPADENGWSEWKEFSPDNPTRSVWVKSDTNNETGDSVLLFEFKVAL